MLKCELYQKDKDKSKQDTPLLETYKRPYSYTEKEIEKQIRGQRKLQGVIDDPITIDKDEILHAIIPPRNEEEEDIND